MRCECYTRNNRRCKRVIKSGEYCFQHLNCLAKTPKRGSPLRKNLAKTPKRGSPVRKNLAKTPKRGTEYTLYYTIFDEDEEPVICENCYKDEIENGITFADALSFIIKRIFKDLRYPGDDCYKIQNFYTDNCMVTLYCDLDLEKDVEDKFVGNEYSFSNLYTVTLNLRITGIEKNESDVKEPGYD